MGILSLAGTASADWSEKHWDAFAVQMNTDKRVLSWQRVSSDLDPLGKGRPVAQVKIDLEKGEMLEGIYSVGAICNKMNKPQWAIDEDRMQAEADRLRMIEERQQYESSLYDELDGICRKYRTSETMIRAVVNRMTRGRRIPEDAHWENAREAFSEGYRGSWNQLKEIDAIRCRGVSL